MRAIALLLLVVATTVVNGEMQVPSGDQTSSNGEHAGMQQMPGMEEMDTGMEHHHHQMDADTMVMNANADELPRDCDEISRDVRFEVMAGTDFASPPNIFGMSRHQWEAPPCSRVTVTFMNHDDVRHQWMIHGLPRYLYPGGMFHLEAAGGATVEGTFIVPSDSKTYLVHCDVAQHMEKGMKAQLKVAGGDGDLWSIPGISRAYDPDRYTKLPVWQLALAGGIACVLVVAGFSRRPRKRDP